MFLPFEVDAILNMPLSFNLLEDKLIWIGNRKGDFTVKNAYYIALGLVEADESSDALLVTQEPPYGTKCGI